jgi:hypothetical protein
MKRMEISAKRPTVRLMHWRDVIRQINMDRVYAFLMILPSIILLGIFVYGFIGQTFLWSLTDWTGLEANVDKQYIGLENYRMLFSDFGGFRFRQELVNTFFFTLFFLVGCLVLGFVLAVLLDQNVKGEGIFRTIFLFPMALSFAVTGTIWRWILNPKGGINVLPELFGGKALSYSWLNSRKPYEFNWHEVPLVTLVLIIGVLLFVFIQLLWRKKYLSLFYLGVPMTFLFLWMGSDWLTWNGAGNSEMHGMFNWSNVPRYVGAMILLGLLVFLIVHTASKSAPLGIAEPGVTETTWHVPPVTGTVTVPLSAFLKAL